MITQICNKKSNSGYIYTHIFERVSTIKVYKGDVPCIYILHVFVYNKYDKERGGAYQHHHHYIKEREGQGEGDDLLILCNRRKDRKCSQPINSNS